MSCDVDFDNGDGYYDDGEYARIDEWWVMSAPNNVHIVILWTRYDMVQEYDVIFGVCWGERSLNVDKFKEKKGAKSKTTIKIIETILIVVFDQTHTSINLPRSIVNGFI